MERKLASLQKIVNIRPIPDADRIEVATILGWEVVINKADNFKVGDLVIYLEVDSIVPPKVEFEFLRERKFRIRTIKLRKQISQGLVLPLNILPSATLYQAHIRTEYGVNWQEGDDVTEIMGVKKYDPQGDAERAEIERKIQHSNSKIQRFLFKNAWYRRLFAFFNPKKDKGFPKFIKKTDEDRIQLFPNICELEKDTVFSYSEKLDGQSLTVFLVKNKKLFGLFGDPYVFGVCSRNLRLGRSDNSNWWKVANKYNLETVLKNMIGDRQFVTIQGEIVGPGIQKNKYGLPELQLYVFDIIFPEGRVHNNIVEMFCYGYALHPVPPLGNIKLFPTIPECVDFAKGKSTIANIPREGIVVRNHEKNLSFKIINPEFLLKYEE